MFDIVILKGTVVDPKTELMTVANIGIKDGKIAAVTREKIAGREEIYAEGKIVCPGFVDIHSHLNYSLHAAWLSAKQGITTCLSGNCGLTPKLPIAEYLKELEEQGYPVNLATLVGHSWALREIAGLNDPYTAASPRQTAEMVKLAEQALEEGAFGISLGLEYAPGADEAEILPLVELAAKYDKLVPIHIRTDALDFGIGLSEAIGLMEKTGARIQISHLAYQFGVHPEVTEMALVMIGNTVKKGIPLMCDSGIYEAFATYIQSPVFDEFWYKRYHCRLSDLMISSGKYVGSRCTPEIYQYVRNEESESETIGTAFVGVLSDLILAIKQPYTMISTDAGLGDKPGTGHPQEAGTYPRVFQKLVRELNVLTMMEAVKKSSWLPARQMGLTQKGYIGSGADADIVVFDPRTIKDNADYVGLGQPDAAPTGVEHVIVNGVAVVSDSCALENHLPGKILRRPNKLWRL